MNINYVTKSLNLFATLLLVGCGGGGGIFDSGVTYTGLTTPAAIVDTNAKTLAEGVIVGSVTGTAFGVVSDEQEVQPNPTILDVVRILSGSVTLLDISPSSSILPGAVVSDSGSVPCNNPGGSIKISLRVDEVTGVFSGTFNFVNCAQGGTSINGIATVSGTINLFSFELEVINFAFNPITVVSGSESYSMSGTVSTSDNGGNVTITMDVRLRNNNTQMVEWMNDLTISGINNLSFMEMTITGRYYHPEHGYVDIATIFPLQFDFFNQWPVNGQMTITGASGSKARLTVISNTQYTLEV
ncbi:MAG: hypothetical protein V3R32_00990, partial [Nitrosomonadaceae bacterium]